MIRRPYWSTEAAPRTASLPHLTAAEAEAYAALCANTYGSAVRLEQELIRFDLVDAALTGGPDDRPREGDPTGCPAEMRYEGESGNRRAVPG